MSDIGRDLLQDARVLGRQLRPDLDAALAAVSARSKRERARPGRKRAVAVALACAAVAVLAVPGLARLHHSGGGIGPGSRARAQSPATFSAAVAQPAGDTLEPAVVLSRANVLASPVSGRGRSAVSAAGATPCAAAALTLEIAFDSAQFGVGQPVAVTQVLRNTSAVTCGVPLDACRSDVSILGPDGAPVYASAADPTWLCAAAPSIVALAPGGIARLTFTWRPASEQALPPATGGVAASAGRYTVVASWGGLAPALQAIPRHLDIGQFGQS
jgi:hypothetical protein